MTSDPWAEFSPAPAPAPAPTAAPASASAAPAHDWSEFTPADSPGVSFAPQGSPGPGGLVWGKDGGRDPQSGELVVAGKPFSQNAPSQALAAGTSFLDGVPIVGPALERGVEAAGGYLRHALIGDPADQVTSAVQGDAARSRDAYPKTSTAAGIAGGIAGIAPAVEAAPAVFGAGQGGLTAGKVGMGSLSGMSIGGADAVVRSGGDPREMGAKLARVPLQAPPVPSLAPASPVSRAPAWTRSAG